MRVNRDMRSKIAYAAACISEFARRKQIEKQEAYIYLADHGAIQFLKEHYDVEHTLSFDEALDDLEIICKQNGGSL